jgi:glutamate-1-semialdehyde 2,1-aminomutase
MNEWVMASGALAAVAIALALRSRLKLSAAKHPSLAGHPRIARWLAKRMPRLRYDPDDALRCDGAPDAVVGSRIEGLRRLRATFASRYARSLALSSAGREALSDLRFTSTYRSPLPYASLTEGPLRAGAFVASTSGVCITDVDGNVAYDLAGSYGVNVFGHAFYKACIARGAALVEELGPVLGPYHPVVVANAQRLRALAGQDEVSFHMSGTEAVMQAVRLARYHTGRRRIVSFAGAYHGWWGDVQPGVGNPVAARDTLVLREMDERTLRILRTRDDIACVLVNPIQAMHPNRSAPTDSALLGARALPRVDRAAYASWLAALREMCTARGIVLIMDEVFVGFRIARGGAQEYFGVRADLVTYGKTLGGGLPVGVVCGQAGVMRRYKDDRPADVCLARGTFNSHPYVMGAMDVFLGHLESPATRELYAGLDAAWDARARRFNDTLAAADLPLEVTHFSSIWSVAHRAPSRFNWLLPYYLRTHGIALSWVGTGRLIFSLDYRDRDVDAVAERFVLACTQMAADGFLWHPAGQSNRAIQARVVRDMAGAMLRLPHRPDRPPREVTPLS